MHTPSAENSSQQDVGSRYGKESGQNTLPKKSLPHAVTARCPESEPSMHHTKVHPETYRKSNELRQILPEIMVQEASGRQARARGKTTQHECLPALLSRRRAQNRESQRAFRERKNQRIKSLEIRLAQLNRANANLQSAYAGLQLRCTSLKYGEDTPPDLRWNIPRKQQGVTQTLPPAYHLHQSPPHDWEKIWSWWTIESSQAPRSLRENEAETSCRSQFEPKTT